MSHICYRCFGETVNEYGVCTACGYLNDTEDREEFPLALPAGSILYGRYIVGKVLGQGGFGITYLAQDYQTKELVAIKEFFPDTMATRTASTTVTPFSGVRGEHFQYGKSSFLQEAQTMAEFIDISNVTKVLMYFEENNTAYFVMEYLDGCSFEEHIRRHGGRLSWEDTMQVMLPVLDTLSYVHEKGIIHRDIAPDNIFITKNGTVKLLDFGAARHSLGNVSQSLDVIVKHGFAPKEQYSRRGRQGPYTDVYATSATIYFALTGVRPDDAIERSTEDTMPPPSVLGAKISAAAEDALMKGLAVEVKDRYQSTAELKNALTVRSGKTTTAKKEDIKKDPIKKDDIKKDDIKKDDTKKRDSGTVSQKAKKQRTLPKWLGFLLIGIVASALSFAIRSVASNINNSEKAAAANTSAPATTIQYVSEEPVSVIQNLMASDTDHSAESDTFWGQDQYKRSDVYAISFVSTLNDALNRNVWDVSAAQDGTVLAWMEDGKLTVAANGKVVLPEDSSCLFGSFRNVTEIDFGGNVDSSKVRDMTSMFAGCCNLNSLDFSGFDTSNAKNFSMMFSHCTALRSLDLSGFDTSNVGNMIMMFSDCYFLRSLDLSSFKCSKTCSLYEMFSGCENLTELICSDETICRQYEKDTGRSVDGEVSVSETTAATEADASTDTTDESQPYLRPHRFAGEYCIDCHVKLYSPEYFSSRGCPGSS